MLDVMGIMLQIDDRLKEACPEPSAILRYLKTQDCGITDVQSVQVESLPCLKFTYDGDGVALLRILNDKRYLPVTESEGVFVTLAYKRKLLKVQAGQTFTVPKEYQPRGCMAYLSVESKEMVKSRREDVLLPEKTYAVLRFAEGEKLPIVLGVDPELWVVDFKANAARANEAQEGSKVSYEEMLWIYNTALMSLD